MNLCYQTAVERFRQAAIEVVLPSDEPATGLEDYLRWFYVPSPGAGRLQVVVALCTRPWTSEWSRLFLKGFIDRLLGQGDRLPEAGPADFHFISAYPIPPHLTYIFGLGEAGRLEADALRTLGGELSPRTVGAVAEVGRALLSRHLGLELDLEAPDSLERLNDVVLTSMRPIQDPRLTLPASTHQPAATLTALGALFGELLRRRHPGQITWTEAPKRMGASAPALLLEGPNGPAGHIFPFSKIVQLYTQGRNRDLCRFYEVVIERALSDHAPAFAALGWEEAADHLLPVLKPDGWSAPGFSVPSVPLEDLGRGKVPAVVVAIDHDRHLDGYVLDSQLEAWSLDFADALGRACANLARRSRHMVDHLTRLEVGEVTLYAADFDDGYAASRILLTDALFDAARRRMPGHELFFVATPCRDQLLLTHAMPVPTAQVFQDLVVWYHERQPAPISPAVFLLSEQGIVGYIDA